MTRLFFLLLLYLNASTALLGQWEALRSGLKPFETVPLTSDCEMIEVDNERNLLLLDSDQSQLTKFFFNTGYDSSIVIGGKSHRNEGFLHPVKISLKNRQNLYLLDDVERRMVLLNTNFKVSGEIRFFGAGSVSNNFLGETEIYPINFDVSVDGTLFILNQLDNKIYVFSPAAVFQLSFGGLDYGPGAIVAPVDIQVNEKNNIFISDTSAGKILVFDNFGNYQATRQPQAGFRWKKFQVSGNTLICFDPKNIYVENMITGQNFSVAVPENVLITDLKLKGEYLYLLQKNAVNLYRIGE
ncbi:MAG: 6-bladed beta-propeller [Bacteroidia bacterium]|nr:6-bladed beta-propeller [Bacteroidia bacterium]